MGKDDGGGGSDQGHEKGKGASNVAIWGKRVWG